MEREQICKACDGSGLLMDDEQWQYTCTVCGGDGVIHPGERVGSNRPIAVDAMKRILE